MCVVPLAQTDSVRLSAHVEVWRGRASGSVVALYTPATKMDRKTIIIKSIQSINHIYTKSNI